MEKEAIQEAIGKRVKELRILLKSYTQEDLAKRIGWDRAYVSRVESGKLNVTIDSISQICHALGITLKEFFSPFGKEFADEIVKGDD